MTHAPQAAGDDEAPDDATVTLALARLDALMAERDAAVARVAAALAILDSDEGFAVKTHGKADGGWSKADRCIHDEWRYEGCTTCLDAALRAVLTQGAAP